MDLIMMKNTETFLILDMQKTKINYNETKIIQNKINNILKK